MKTIKSRFRKVMLIVASFAMIFTSLFGITSVRAASENIYFDVNKADEVITEAQKHIGKPYVWGAGGPNSFDCSGYMSYIFKQVGLKFNADRFTTKTLEAYFDGMNVTNYQYSTNEGMPANAKRGDIIFYYDNTGDPMHMGLYLGNGQIIHCAASMPSGPQQQVMVSSVDALGEKHGTTIVSYKVYRVFPESGGVRLQKTDEFGNKLAGVKFEITMPVGSSLVVTTNSNGYWDSEESKLDLKAGTYSYREISTIEGYLLDSTTKTFTVKAGVKAQQNAVYVTNKEPSGQIKVIKTNTNNDRVANTTFNVYVRENITNKAGTKTHYTNGQLVQTITTNGNGEVLTKSLPLGKYKVVETQVPDRYVLNTNVFDVDILYKDQVTPIVSSSVTISNKEQIGKIILKKAFDTSLVDEKTGDAYLQGNQYALIAKEKITNAAGTITYYQKDQLVSNKTTDSNGLIEWDNLPLGNYYIIECQFI